MSRIRMPVSDKERIQLLIKSKETAVLDLAADRKYLLEETIEAITELIPILISV